MVAGAVRIVKKTASMGVLVVLTVAAGATAWWLGTRPHRHVEKFCAGPSVVERLAEGTREGTRVTSSIYKLSAMCAPRLRGTGCAWFTGAAKVTTDR
jgi:hypothetical protein